MKLLYSLLIFCFLLTMLTWTMVSSPSVRTLEGSISKFISSYSWFSSLYWNSLTLLRLSKFHCNGSRNFCLALVKRFFAVAFFRFKNFFLTSISALFSSCPSITYFYFFFLSIVEYLQFFNLRLIFFRINLP